MALEEQEAEWIAQAQQGDSQAFSELVMAYQTPVYNLCYRMLGNAGDAEDAAQESFIRAYKAIRRFDPKRKFSSWLLSIASNYCIDQHRRRKLPSFSYDEFEGFDVPDHKPGIESGMVRGEEQESIQRLLDGLNAKDRAVVVLRYWYEYSYEEIAQELSLTTSAVKSRLHRARQNLAVDWSSQQSESMISERKQYETPMA